MLTAKLEGADVLERRLSALDAKISRKIGAQAMRAGAKVVLDEAKSKAPVGKSRKDHKAGTLKASLKVRAGKRKKGVIRFLVQTKDGDYKGDTFYGAFVSFGHKIGSRKGTRKKIGFEARKPGKRGRAKGIYQNTDTRKATKPNEWIRQAFAAKKEAALSTIINTLRTGIESAARL